MGSPCEGVGDDGGFTGSGGFGSFPEDTLGLSEGVGVPICCAT